MTLHFLLLISSFYLKFSYTQNGLTCSGVTNYSWDNTNWKVSYSTSNLTSQNVSCTVSFCTKDYCNATFRQLVKLIGSSAVSFDDLVNSEYDINNIVKSQSAMELIASSKDYLSKNIKSSSYYCSKKVWKKFLDSTVISNLQKYYGRLPFYLYNNGTTGFSWSRSSYNGNCTTSECSKGTISSTSTLLVKDATTTQYVFGEIASEAIDITDYSSMEYEANFNGTNTGSNEQKVQQGYRILAGNNVLEKGNMRDGVIIGSISMGDSVYCKNNINSYSGSQQIKIRLTTGGLTSYKASISVPYIYFY